MSSSALFSRLQAASPFFLVSGPNVLQNSDINSRVASALCGIQEKFGVPVVFKASFDKANRTSLDSYRGPGLEEGLRMLEGVKAQFRLPVLTDIHETSQAKPVGEVADIVQIPSFLCRQTDLLVAAAHTGRVINIKRGQFASVPVMVNAADKVRRSGNPNVMVCERGTSMGPDNLIVDPRSLVNLRQSGGLVLCDVTHSVQQPAQRSQEVGAGMQFSSGGDRSLIPAMARMAVAVGVHGLFLEVHPDPDNSPCDPALQWPLDKLHGLLSELVAIGSASQWKGSQ